MFSQIHTWLFQKDWGQEWSTIGRASNTENHELLKLKRTTLVTGGGDQLEKNQGPMDRQDVHPNRVCLKGSWTHGENKQDLGAPFFLWKEWGYSTMTDNKENSK